MNQMALSCAPSSVREDAKTEPCALDGDDDVGTRVNAAPRRQLPVRDRVVATGTGLDANLRRQVLFLEPVAEGRVAPGREFHRDGDAIEQRRKRPGAESVHQA
jgi:hypothetical protein